MSRTVGYDVTLQMWMNASRTTEDAVNLPRVPTYLIVSTAPVTMDTPVTVSSAQVRQLFR